MYQDVPTKDQVCPRESVLFQIEDAELPSWFFILCAIGRYDVADDVSADIIDG